MDMPVMAGRCSTIYHSMRADVGENRRQREKEQKQQATARARRARVIAAEQERQRKIDVRLLLRLAKKHGYAIRKKGA